MTPLSVIILTGQSGSGKSTAVRALEDQDFVCIDNLPANLAPTLVENLSHTSDISHKVALVIDARQPEGLPAAAKVVQELRASPHKVRVVYFEAREDSLLRRYSETRRRHPLDNAVHAKGLRQAILKERELLAPLRELADDTIDTSALSVHQLRAKVVRQLTGGELGDDLSVSLVSFGFKYGSPLDCDMIFDVRFLRNPYFDRELRPKTGLDPAVRDYIFASEDTGNYLRRTVDYIEFLLPHFQREGKRYLTIAIGCTGGQHRSVAMVEAIAAELRDLEFLVDIRHRDAKGERKI